MDTSLLLAFVGAAILLALMPGPDNLYVLCESIVNGSRRGVIITSGLVSGVVVHTFLAATGLTILIYSSDIGFTVVKVAGALYLVYLAYQASKEVPLALELADKPDERSFWSLYKQGVLMNVLNPKVSLFFIALLPQFITKDGWPPIVQMMVLGLLFMTQAFVIFSGIAVVAARLVSLVENERFWIVTKWLKVSVLLILAITLILSSQ